MPFPMDCLTRADKILDIEHTDVLGKNYPEANGVHCYPMKTLLHVIHKKSGKLKEHAELLFLWKTLAWRKKIGYILCFCDFAFSSLKIPPEMMYKEKTIVSFFKVFGCFRFVHIERQICKK